MAEPLSVSGQRHVVEKGAPVVEPLLARRGIEGRHKGLAECLRRRVRNRRRAAVEGCTVVVEDRWWDAGRHGRAVMGRGRADVREVAIGGREILTRRRRCRREELLTRGAPGEAGSGAGKVAIHEGAHDGAVEEWTVRGHGHRWLEKRRKGGWSRAGTCRWARRPGNAGMIEGGTPCSLDGERVHEMRHVVCAGSEDDVVHKHL